MFSIAQLCEQDPDLENLSGLLLRVVAAPVADPASVAALRWNLAQALLDHCERRDRACAERMPVEVPSPDAARRSREALATLCGAFAHYIADWSMARIAAEWQEFGRETEAVLAARAGLPADSFALDDRRAA